MKKLPKAISRTADEMRGTPGGFGAREQQEALARLADLDHPSHRVIAASGHAFEAIEAAPVEPVSVPPDGSVPIRAVAAGSAADAQRRRSLARTIVERHAAYSAVGGIIPLPIANVASITALIVRMVKMLSILYGVPFERDRARAVVIGLMGGAMPTGLAAATASTLFYIVPGSNLVGLAVCSIAAAAATRSIGRIFIEHFESGADLDDFPVSDG